MDNSASSRSRLVLVDDDEVEALILRRYLEKTRGNIDLTVFDSGQEFLDYMAAAKTGGTLLPDVILLDVRMPGLDGFSVLSKLRTDPSFATESTIVMFSNSDDEADVKRALDLGASGYRPKPQDGEEYAQFLEGLGLRN